MRTFEELQEIFENHLLNTELKADPSNLYDPISYIMQLGGKRIRPLLLMAANNLYSSDFNDCLPLALGIEMFHNFTLVHDDIMDDAPLRRGHQTVHEKWDSETAILAGDAMLISSYQYFENLEPDLFKAAMQIFSKTSIELCEGQRMDMDFETRDELRIEDYFKMIEYKTAVLIACALKIGGLIGGASQEDAEHLYQFGKNIGISFQIQDDLLDVFGDNPKVGKKKAGDIVQNKKTYLYLKSLELLGDKKADELRALYKSDGSISESEKIERVTALFKTAQVHIYSEELKEAYLTLGLSHLTAVNVDEEKKEVLKKFAKFLLVRKF